MYRRILRTRLPVVRACVRASARAPVFFCSLSLRITGRRQPRKTKRCTTARFVRVSLPVDNYFSSRCYCDGTAVEKTLHFLIIVKLSLDKPKDDFGPSAHYREQLAFRSFRFRHNRHNNASVLRRYFIRFDPTTLFNAIRTNVSPTRARS